MERTHAARRRVPTLAMANRVYALLVGVNDYGPDIPSLDGCLNDVDLLHDYLTRHVEPAALAVEVLKNGDATRAAVIDRFRSHLGQAGADDVALFQFCGHGAQGASSAAFREAFPDGLDEGLVCFDSRRSGGYDLADKELAVLIAEVAANHAHTVVLLDCCHSGTGTRSVDATRTTKPRLTQAITTERPLESYLDGHYARLRDASERLFVPSSRHILLAACERGQLAQEAPGHGIFTSTLVDVLTKSGGDLSYADLFVRCRAAVRARAFDQDPQFEAFDRFDAGRGFLARPTTGGARGRYLAYCDQGAWTVECGAIQGLPTDPGSVITLALHPESDPGTMAGTATAIQVGPQTSEIALDFESRESARYLAELTSLPAAPVPIAFAGDEATRATVQDVLRAHGVPCILGAASDRADVVLTASSGRLALTAAGRDQPGARDQVIGFADLADGAAPAAASLAPAVRHVLQWRRSLGLQNARTALDRSQVDVIFAERLDGGGERVHDGPDIAVDYVSAGGQWRRIRGRLRVRSRAAQPLAVLLAYFSDDYGVYILGQDILAPGGPWLTLWGDGPSDDFYLADGVDASIERFSLVISTEKVDEFLLAQPALPLGERYGGDRATDGPERPRVVALTNEWFTRDVPIRVVRRPPTT